MAVNEHTVEIRYGEDHSSNYFNFSGMPTPYVSRSQEMVYFGKKWCQLTTITLDGTIIGSEPIEGENLNTLSLVQDRKKILSGFKESFQRLGIYENNTPYATFEGCIVRDVSFSPANYGIQEYSINLECFDADEFLGTFGVMEPSETVDFTDNQDGTVGISHSISAQGFTTSTVSDGSNIAITNAKNYVESRTGYKTNKVIPQFLGGISDSNLVITNISKDINRADGTYACNIDYLVQTGDIGEIPIVAGGYVSIIDSNVNSGVEDEFVQVGVTYTLQGDKYKTPTALRSAQPSTGTLFKIATGAAGIENLSVIPLNLDVEDTADTNKTIVVKASYDNDTIYESLGTGVYYDHNVDISTDDITDTATVSINGEIKARGNNRAQFALKSGYYFDYVSGKLFDLANEKYTGVNYHKLYSNVAWPLNPIEVSHSVDMDEIAGTVSVSASFNNKDFKAGYRDFTYKIDVTPALNQYSLKPSCNQNGLYTVFDIRTNTREKVGLSIQAKGTYDEILAQNNFHYIEEGVHDYSNTLRGVLLTNTPVTDLVIEGESSNGIPFNRVGNTAGNVAQAAGFDASVNQSYTYLNDTSFF